MAIINKTGIINGGTIQAEHVTRTIDALSGVSTDTIVATGSFTGSFQGSITTTSDTTINGSLQQGLSTTTIGASSHAEGSSTIAYGQYSHAEGGETVASGSRSHSEGYKTYALGPFSHSEGLFTTAYGTGSHSEGVGTVASGSYPSSQHVEGQWNTHGDATSLLIVGNGTADGARSDAFKVRMSGSIVLPTTQSAAPTWTGTNGEMVFATVGGVHLMYLYMSGAWRSASFA
jgi:hypothetical protein